MFNRKRPRVELVENADLIDLLLHSDQATRRQLVSEAIGTGALTASKAEDLLAQAARLERAAGPRPFQPVPGPEPRPGWGIDYP